MADIIDISQLNNFKTELRTEISDFKNEVLTMFRDFQGDMLRTHYVHWLRQC